MQNLTIGDKGFVVKIGKTVHIYEGTVEKTESAFGGRLYHVSFRKKNGKLGKVELFQRDDKSLDELSPKDVFFSSRDEAERFVRRYIERQLQKLDEKRAKLRMQLDSLNKG